MLTDDAIRLGQEAGFNDYQWQILGATLGRFASLVEAETLKQFASGVKVFIPTLTMEQEFQSHYRRGYAAAKAETLKAHQQAIEAAVLREREACAELCDSMKTTRLPDGDDDVERGFNGGLRRASSYIRARTQLIRIEDAHKEDGHGQSST